MTKQPLAFLAFALLLGASASALGSIVGTITDPQGNPVAGAEVELLLDKEVLKTTSAADGTYRLPTTQEQLLSSNLATLRATATVGTAKMIGIDDGSFFDHDKPLIDAVGVPIDIELRPTYRTEIIVRDAQGNPVGGAQVEALIDFQRGFKAPFSGPLTDANGRSFVEIPDNVLIRDVWVVKSGIGLDYLHNTIPPEQAGLDLRGESDRIAERLPETIEFTLHGAEKYTVHVQDAQGKPVEGAAITPWIIGFSGQTDSLNLSGSRIAETLSDAEGNAVLDWIPVNRLGFEIEFHCTKNNVGLSQRPQLQRGIFEQTVTLTTQQKSVSGTVFDETGKPLPGVLVDVLRQNRTLTDEEGKYRLVFDVEEGTQVLTVRFRPPLELSEHNLVPSVIGTDSTTDEVKLDHTFQQGTVVRAKIVVNNGRTSYQEMLAQTKLLGRRAGTGPFFFLSSGSPDFIPYSFFNRLDKDGAASFVLPPGQYNITSQVAKTRPVGPDISGSFGSRQTVIIPYNPEERERAKQSGAFDLVFRCTTIDTVDRQLQVFRVDPATGEKTPEKNAVVYISRDYDISFQEWKTVITDENGVTTIRRAVPAPGKTEAEPLVYMAHSADSSFSTFGVWHGAYRDHSSEPRAVELQPTVTIKGRFVDSSDEPVSDGGIIIFPRPIPRMNNSVTPETPAIALEAASLVARGCALLRCIPDEDGRFEVKGLFPNMIYDIRYKKHVMECDATGCSTRLILSGSTTITAEGASVYDVGDVRCVVPTGVSTVTNQSHFSNPNELRNRITQKTLRMEGQDRSHLPVAAGNKG